MVGSGMRVYLCDDNRSHRVLVRTVLASEPDLEIVGEAELGGECVEKAGAAEPDVVLVDNRMPGLDGLEVLPALRRALPETKLVMLSTAWTPETERAALRAGADAYVQKPRNIFDLPSLVRGAVGEAGALVEQLVRNWLRGERERAYAAMHHDVEFRPLTRSEVVHGLEAMKRFHAMAPEATIVPRALLEHGQDVLFLAHAEVAGAEQLDPAWLLTVRNGKVARISTYETWDEAQAEAGFDAETPSVRRQVLDAGWRFLRAIRLRPARASYGL
jgi:DNA-binding NarL/FixJ family response regulator